MRAKIEVELSWMANSNIDSCTSWNIARLSNLVVLVLAEQSERKNLFTVTYEYSKPRMMSFLNDYEGDTGLIRRLQLDASFSDSPQLVSKDRLKLTFRDTIPRNVSTYCNTESC